MAIGRVNAPLGDYFVGDNIKEEHLAIETSRGIEMRRKGRNEYSKDRSDYAEDMVVAKDGHIYIISEKLIKLNSDLQLVWKKGLYTEIWKKIFYNYYQNRLYVDISKNRLAVFDMDGNELKIFEGVDVFTWDEKGNLYILSKNDSTLTIRAFNNNLSQIWSRSYTYTNYLTSAYCLKGDDYIYIPGKKIDTNTKGISNSHDFASAVTNHELTHVAYGNYSETAIQSNNLNHTIKLAASDVKEVDSGGNLIIFNEGNILKLSPSGILLGFLTIDSMDRDKQNRALASFKDNIYVAGAEGWTSTGLSDYAFIEKYTAGSLKNIQITGVD